VHRVPFQQALSLLSARAVYLERGSAFVPLQRLVTILLFRFRSALSKTLAEASLAFDSVGGDARIAPFIQVFNIYTT
jgi:hypothetical protein